MTIEENLKEKSFEFTLNVKIIPFHSEAFDIAQRLYNNGLLQLSQLIFIRCCEELRLKKVNP